MTTFETLIRIMATLRSANGCPWDREQDSISLKPYLIEETYEVIDAIDRKEPQLLKEELGDLLLQIVFHAQIWSERGDFSIDDVIEAICAKLIKRHPHVFADTFVDNAQQVLVNWEKIKLEEKREKHDSLLSGVPRHLPSLLMGQRVQEKVARVGFDWENWQGSWQKIIEEMAELKEAIDSGEKAAIEDEFGDLMFTMVNLARALNVNAEETMRQAVGKFVRRFQKLENNVVQENRDLSTMTLQEMDELWNKVKTEDS